MLRENERTSAGCRIQASPHDREILVARSVRLRLTSTFSAARPFVIAFGGKAIIPGRWRDLAYHDVNLLAALGIRLVGAGARRRSRRKLREKGLPSSYHGRYRVTDAAALDWCVIDAVGSVYLNSKALLSQGLPDTLMANSTIRVIGGNFITARPVGVIEGVDMQYAGAVRKVDADGIRAQLGLGNIVLLSCLAPARPARASTWRWRRWRRRLPWRSTPTSWSSFPTARARPTSMAPARRTHRRRRRSPGAHRRLAVGRPQTLSAAPVRASCAGVGRVCDRLRRGRHLLRELFSRDGVER